MKKISWNDRVRKEEVLTKSQECPTYKKKEED